MYSFPKVFAFNLYPTLIFVMLVLMYFHFSPLLLLYLPWKREKQSGGVIDGLEELITDVWF